MSKRNQDPPRPNVIPLRGEDGNKRSKNRAGQVAGQLSITHTFPGITRGPQLLPPGFEEEPDPWADIGAGDPRERRSRREKRERKGLVDKLGTHMEALDIGFGVIRDEDRFGAGLMNGMSLLIRLAGDDYEGDIDQFAKQNFSPAAALLIHGGERKARVRVLEAKRAINSLGILKTCMARVGGDMPAGPIIEDLAGDNSSLIENEAAEVLVGEIAQDSRQLVQNLGPKDPQKIQKFIDKLSFRIFAASRMPMATDFSSYRRTAQRDYAGEAWDRFFNINSEGPTNSTA